jgi:putative transposase
MAPAALRLHPGCSLAKENRMQTRDDRIIAELMEQLIETGPEGMASMFTAMLNLAMRLERERHVGAQAYERTAERSGYANGYKARKVDTPAGTLTVQVPKSRGGDAPFYPQALERGRRSSRAVMLAIAQMYIQGVSTRDVEKVMAEFGLESLSSSQVSRAAALLDRELEAWRTRPLGAFPYLFLDARYEKVRIDGVVRDAAILSAIGIDENGKRSVLGLSVALSEAEVHWRGFLDSLVARGLRGVRFITSDDHAGLVAARKAVFPGAVWQRCQFHLARNAIHHAPSAAARKAIGRQLRSVWNATDRASAEAELARLVKTYEDNAPKLAAWLERNVPEGLAVLQLPEAHWRRMRTANPMERAIQQELKRRTRKIRVFPNETALERLATAILVEIDEEWIAADRAYITMSSRDG